MQTVTIQGRTYNYSHAIGRGSPAGAGFRNPVDLALGHEDKMYVLSRGSEAEPCQRVTVLSLNEEFLGEFGGPGHENGEFIWPTAIAIDSEGFVYVSDEWLNRITVFDQEGQFVRNWGNSGSNEGQLNGPAGLVFDREDNILITENLNHRVQKFSKHGKFIGSFGQHGSGFGELTRPWGVAIDSQNDIYVADWYNDRIQKFSSSGAYIRTFDEWPGDGNRLKRPSDVAVDSQGDIYITDWWNKKVEIFDSCGVHLTTFFGDALNLSKWAQHFIDSNPDYQKARMRVKSFEDEWKFNMPISVEVSADGFIYVVEDQRWRIQVYRKDLHWIEPQFNL